MNDKGIKINSFSFAQYQDKALVLLNEYPYTAKELSEELELSIDHTRTVLKRLEQQKLIWCKKRRYLVKATQKNDAART